MSDIDSHKHVISMICGAHTYFFILTCDKHFFHFLLLFEAIDPVFAIRLAFCNSKMQENRVQTLRKEVDHCVKMAELIEYNLEDVDAAILAVRVALANGMNWDDLARMVKEEKKSGNPVAGLIDKLHLERNCITLLLSNDLDEMDEDEKTSPVDRVLLLAAYNICSSLCFLQHLP